MSDQSAAGDKEMEEDRPLQGVLDQAIEAAEGDELKVSEILDAYGRRSFGPVIALLAVIVISPVGAVPFLPIVFAVLILLISVQLLFGRQRPWVPNSIRNIGVDLKKAKSFRDKADGVLKKVDGLISQRLEWAAGPTAQYLAAICICVLALIMGAPPLEMIPYAVAIPGAAILLFGLGLTARDGLLILFGFAVTALASWLGYQWIFTGEEGDAVAALDAVFLTARA